MTEPNDKLHTLVGYTDPAYVLKKRNKDPPRTAAEPFRRPVQSYHTPPPPPFPTQIMDRTWLLGLGPLYVMQEANCHAQAIAPPLKKEHPLLTDPEEVEVR